MIFLRRFSVAFSHGKDGFCQRGTTTTVCTVNGINYLNRDTINFGYPTLTVKGVHK